MNTRYTQAEIDWLRANYNTGSVQDSIDAFARKFGRVPKRSSFISKASTLGLKKDATLAHHKWTAEAEAWFREFVPGHSEREISAEHERLFGVPLTESQIGNAKHRLGVKSGTNGGRFQKGNVPHNKGRSWDEQGISPESQARSRATCFKKGQVSGIAAVRKREIGFERVSKDGYIEVKVKDGLQGEANDNFRMKHQLVWEEANGQPVPPSTHIVFADGDKRNFDPDNLVAVPRSLWAAICKHRMQYHDAESLRACMNVARLYHAAYAASLTPRRCQKCGRTFKPRYPHQRTCDGCLERMRA